MPGRAVDEETPAGGWTFEALAEAGRDTLERVLRAGEAPNPGALESYVYRGWNHGWVTTLSGRKFRKEFHRREGGTWGCNRLVRREGSGPRGEWEPKLRDGRPIRIGHYRVVPVTERPSGWVGDRYRDLALLDYGVALNRGLQLPLRMIRDFVALPNPGDHGLLLGKAYLRLGHRRLCVFYSYFVLGHPAPIPDQPHDQPH